VLVSNVSVDNLIRVPTLLMKKIPGLSRTVKTFFQDLLGVQHPDARRIRSSFSSTFQDLKLSFPGLYRTKLIFQDFPRPGKSRKNIGISRMRGNP